MRHNKKGYAVLAMTLVVLLAISLLAIFISKMLVSEHHGLQNKYHEQQALQAAKAGAEYALKYAETNRDALTNGQTLTGTLGNSATYSVQINFLDGNNNLLGIVSTGTSPDGTTTRTVEEKLKWQESASGGAITTPLTVKGAIVLSGNTEIINIENNTTIDTGAATVGFSGNAKTTIASGVGSNSSGINADVNLNNATLSALSAADFEASFLGSTISSMVSAAATAPNTTYNNSGTTNYNSELANTSGEKIYINQNGGTATIDGTTNIGTAGSPVTLVVDGSLVINGTVDFYGDIYVNGNVTLLGNAEIVGNVIFTGSGNFSGNTDIEGDVAMAGAFSASGNMEIDGLVLASGSATASGNARIHGGLAVGGAYSASGNSEITYDSANVGLTLLTGGVYGVVSGSWKDF